MSVRRKHSGLLCPRCCGPLRLVKVTKGAAVTKRALRCPGCGLRCHSEETVTLTYSVKRERNNPPVDKPQDSPAP